MPWDIYGLIAMVVGIGLVATSPMKRGFADKAGNTHAPTLTLRGRIGRWLVLAGIGTILFGFVLRLLVR